MSLQRTLLLPLLLLAAACSSDPAREPGGIADDTAVSDTGSDSSGSADTGEDTTADTSPADTNPDTGAEPDTADDTAPDTAADTTADTDTPPDLCAPVVRSSPLPRPLSADAASHTWQERRGGLVFDSEGHGVVADADGNLYRIEPTGRRTLWVADAFEAVEAMVYLRTGELAVVDPILGRIRLVYPNGEARTLVTDLDHPVGLDLDLDGFLMLSEATSATISRIDPTTGGRSPIFRGLDFVPGGLAFAADYNRLYIIARGAGAVYAMDRDSAGVWAEPAIFGRVGDQSSSCTTETIGQPCLFGTEAGYCRDAGSGPLCASASDCSAATAGDLCEPTPGETGRCVDYGFGLTCQASAPCDGASQGDACVQSGVPGVCNPDSFGGLSCGPPNLCATAASGTDCVQLGLPGLCRSTGFVGGSYCDTDPCLGRLAGAGCSNYPGMTGACRFSGGALACIEVSACTDALAGDTCLQNDVLGRCANIAGSLSCEPPPSCASLAFGSACEEYGDAGTCVDGGGFNYCDTNSCLGSPLGTACTRFGQPGACADGFCIVGQECAGAADGDSCFGQFGLTGTCTDSTEGALTCQTYSSCAGRTSETCTDMFRDVLGLCALNAADEVFCDLQNPCDGAASGTSCSTLTGEAGRCATGDAGLGVCVSANPCLGQFDGASCTSAVGNPGICTFGFSGLVCIETEQPCRGSAAGDSCLTEVGGSGRCTESGAGALLCLPSLPCEGGSSGEACVTSGGQPGVCEATGDGVLLCVAAGGCTPTSAGARCLTESGANGTCVAGAGDRQTWCLVPSTSPDITAITTDGCGGVYVADLATGAIWRSIDGPFEPLSPAPTGRVTGLAWANGSVGWNPSRLYLASEGGRLLSSLEPGAGPRQPIMPERTDTVPTGPERTFRVNCRNLPSSPIATIELGNQVGYHDLAFDEFGYMIGSSGSALVAVNRAGQVQAYAPGLGGVQGMDWLPDGTMVVNSSEGVVSIAPSGARRTLAGIYGYGITVGPDGLIYSADNDSVYRIDPDTGETEVYLSPATYGQSWGPRNIEFDSNFEVMYIGSFGDWVYALTIDETVKPVGAPRQFAKVRDNIRWQDGLGGDACGNLFVPNYDAGALFRLRPDGQTETFITLGFPAYGHAVEWGNGIGGWAETSIFLPQPYDSNTVLEIELGVPGREALYR
jgi:hypothetical protein